MTATRDFPGAGCAIPPDALVESAPGVVSVVVPLYNRAALISETLDSINAQTYWPLEVVVVDDGSTDGGLSRVQSWKRDHQRPGFDVRVLCQPNAGAPSARNRGLKETREEFTSGQR